MKTLGEILKELRIQNNLTLSEAAQKLNVDASSLSKIENDFRRISTDLLKEISKLYNFSQDELEIEFIKNDLTINYKYFDNFQLKIQTALSRFQAENSINKLISSGESKTLEYKSSIRYCLKTEKAEKYIEHSSIKNICAFLNSNGGTLIIGIDDNSNIIGLENTDFKTFKDENKIDALLKHLDNLISKYFGNEFVNYINIKIENIDFKTIAIIEVKENNLKPTILVNSETKKEEFYIRRNASAIALTLKETIDYCKEKWK